MTVPVQTATELRFSDTCTDADGTGWAVREATPVSWPRLLHIRHEVSDQGKHERVPGKVRAKKVPLPRPSSRNKARTYERDVWVYHSADAAEQAAAPDVTESFRSADRQQIPHGKYRGRWVLSPGEVARRLDVDITYVSLLAKNGIPWMPRVAYGRNRGKKQKPRLVQLKNGYYGHHDDFWLEDDVTTFAAARKNVPTPADFAKLHKKKVTVSNASKAGDISAPRAYEKIRNDDIASETVILRFPEKVNGKKGFSFTKPVVVISADDAASHRQAGVVSPVPAGRLTVREVAKIFRKSPSWVCWCLNMKRFPELGNKKPTKFTDEPLLIEYTDPSTRQQVSMRTHGYHLLKSEWKAIWEARYPGKPWPLDDPKDHIGAAEPAARALEASPLAEPAARAGSATAATKFRWRSEATRQLYELLYTMREAGNAYDRISNAGEKLLERLNEPPQVLTHAAINRNAKLYADREGLPFSPRS